MKMVSAICRQHLHDFVRSTPGIAAVMVASVDGFEVTSILNEKIFASKLAALSSTMYALGETVVMEAGISDCQNVIVETPANKIIMMAVPKVDMGLLFTAIADSQSQFGMLLLSCHRCCDEISEDLQHSR